MYSTPPESGPVPPAFLSARSTPDLPRDGVSAQPRRRVARSVRAAPLLLCIYACLSQSPVSAQAPAETLTFSENGATEALDLVGVPEQTDSIGGGDLARNGQVFAAGDFDDDGFLDLVIGVPLEDVSTTEDAGVLHVVPGGPDGPDATAPGEQVWDQGTGIDGTVETDDLFGFSVVTGYFNDDEFADVAVGAPGEAVSAGGLQYSGAGAVHIIYGSADGLQDSNDRKLWQGFNIDGGTVPGGLESNDQFGFSLAAGDFNCDGLDDLAIGARQESFGTGGPGTIVSAGSVVVLYATDDGLVPPGADYLWREGTATNYERFGSALAAGRFNDDACVDLAVGVPSHNEGAAQSAGAVDVFYGAEDGLDRAARETWTLASPDVAGTPATSDAMGRSLAAGDFNGDGVDDLAAGMPTRRRDVSRLETGALIVLYGTADGLSGEGSLYVDQDSPGVDRIAYPNDQFGRALAAGDMDGDGVDDLAVGIPGKQLASARRGSVDYAGSVMVFTGVADVGIVTAGHRVLDEELVGEPVQSAGLGAHLLMADLNGSGRADLVAGVPGRTVSDGSEDITFAGEVVVRLSPEGPLIFMDGFESGDLFAWF